MQEAPAAPTPPDPTKTAAAQTQGDVQSAIANSYLQNANQVGPLGSVNYAQSGTHTIKDAEGNPIDVPSFTQTTTLSPDQQHLLDQQTQLGGSLNDLAQSQTNRLSGVLNQPVTTNNLPASVTSLSTPTFQNYGSNPTFQDYGPGPSFTNASTTFGNTAGNIQYNVGPTDFTADRDATTAAMMSRLQPEMDRERAAMQTNLANQGITNGSAAWNNATDAFNRQQNDANMQGILAGNQEQNTLFGQKVAQGQFTNAAQNQDYTQQQGRGLYALNAINQNNTAAQQGYQNTFNAIQGNNTNAQQGYQDAFNTTQANNQNAQQGFANQATAGDFANTSRQNALQEQLAVRDQPIQEISALMHGGTPTLPQFSQFNPGSVPGSTIGQDTYNSANLANQQWLAQTQMASAGNTGLFGLGSAALGGLGKIGASAVMMSDIRVKKNIEKIGDAARFGIYRFHYLSDEDAAPLRVGYMAQEVEMATPEAVIAINGVKHVNYARAGH